MFCQLGTLRRKEAYKWISKSLVKAFAESDALSGRKKHLLRFEQSPPLVSVASEASVHAVFQSTRKCLYRVVSACRTLVVQAAQLANGS